MDILPEEDRPAAAAIHSEKQPVFHFEKGPVAVTITKTLDEPPLAAEFNPLDENSEEIDLLDVECFDQDPMPAQADCLQPPPPGPPPAEPDENDGLPFEG